MCLAGPYDNDNNNVFKYTTFSRKGSNALYNESQGGETGHQPVKAPMAAKQVRPQHWGLRIRPLLFLKSDVGSLTSPTNLVCTIVEM